jgi:hypothetical protein
LVSWFLYGGFKSAINVRETWSLKMKNKLRARYYKYFMIRVPKRINLIKSVKDTTIQYGKGSTEQ